MKDTITFSGEGLAAAVSFACEIHAKQVRKGSNTPYVSHLLATASTVMHCGGDEETTMAAVLHDAVEDQPDQTDLDDIASRFGGRVASLVGAVTEPPKHVSWPERKDAYERQLQKDCDEAVLISLADKAHNLASLVDDLRAHGDQTWSKFKAGKDASVARYRRLMDLYQARLGDQPNPRAILQRMEHDLEVASG